MNNPNCPKCKNNKRVIYSTRKISYTKSPIKVPEGSKIHLPYVRHDLSMYDCKACGEHFRGKQTK